MATVEVTIPEIDIGALDVVESHTERRLMSWQKERRPRLLIQGKDGTKVLADATPEQIDLFEMVWRATNYGTEGEDEEQTLADLRAAHTAMRARWMARTDTMGVRAAE